MAMTTQTLGIGRKVLKRLITIEEANVESQYKDTLGRVDTTTQTFEIYKQLAGLGYATQTPEGDTIGYDDWAQLFARSFYPYQVTKGIRYSVLMDYTNQYKDALDKQPAMIRSFLHTKNLVAANIDNRGFTATTDGMNGETLYSLTHSMGSASPVGANMPATAIALSPLAIEQALTEMRNQKSARATPMPVTGKILLKVPSALEWPAKRYVKSTQMALTNNNDLNVTRDRLEIAVNDYYTSTTAWFMRTMQNEGHGLFLLEQMPYQNEKLARTDNLMDTWASWESYIAGWMDWHGTWASAGV